MATSTAINPTTGKSNAQVLAQSTAVAQSAAKAIGGSYSSNAGGTGGFTPGPSTPSAATSAYLSAGGKIPSTITSANTAPAPSIILPTPPAPTNTGTNAMTQIGGTAAAATANTPATPPVSTPTDADTAFQTYLKSIQAPPNTADAYTKARAESGVDADQQAVNTYQSQLNAITAKAQADKLSLVGKGNGVPNPIIGGQQAEIDREAAIQALPVSAQLAAAQANLTLAQDNLNTLFKLRSEDAQNQVTYKNSLITAVYNFADSKQKTQLAAMQKTNDQNFSLMTNNLNYAQSLATAAISNGQPGIAAQLMKLDHNDPNYASNIAALAKGIVVEKKPAGLSTEQTNAIIGSALSDANAAIAGGADPIATRSAFLAKHPAAASDWNAYFATTDDTKTSYPTPAPSGGQNLLEEVANWFKKQ